MQKSMQKKESKNICDKCHRVFSDPRYSLVWEENGIEKSSKKVCENCYLELEEVED